MSVNIVSMRIDLKDLILNYLDEIAKLNEMIPRLSESARHRAMGQIKIFEYVISDIEGVLCDE